MDVYEMTDQPETCRRCGTRTETMRYGIDSKTGLLANYEKCPLCGYEYIVEEADPEEALLERLRGEFSSPQEALDLCLEQESPIAALLVVVEHNIEMDEIGFTTELIEAYSEQGG